MGRAPCCDKANVKKGPWSPEEDEKLKEYMEKHGTGGNWIALPQKAGLKRCGKSCRLRWLNYLRPNIKHGEFSDDEDRIICSLFASIGSRWSIIAAQLPGRTDNDIKNYWNTKLKKKLMGMVPSSLNQNRNHYPSSISPLLLHQQSLPSSSSSHYINTTQLLSTGSFIEVPISSSSTTTADLLPSTSSVLMFGGEGSTCTCSSSDGSYSNNNNNNHPVIGHSCREMELTYGLLMQSGYDLNGGGLVDDQNQKFDGYQEQKPNGFFYGQTTTPVLDYTSLEEIKKLISTNNNNDNNNNNNICNNLTFFLGDDENKPEEKVIYY